MFQYSIYVRHCGSKENADVHKRRVKRFLPDTGKVCMLFLTDKQFGDLEIFYGKKRQSSAKEWTQLELF